MFHSHQNHILINGKYIVCSAVEDDEKPLVIPLKENKKNLVDRIKEVQRKAKSETIETEVQDTRPDSDLTIDELAARELIRGILKCWCSFCDV